MTQGMLIFKQRRIGGPVGAHQDSTFLFTDPPSCVGLWTALQVQHCRYFQLSGSCLLLLFALRSNESMTLLCEKMK